MDEWKNQLELTELNDSGIGQTNLLSLYMRRGETGIGLKLTGKN